MIVLIRAHLRPNFLSGVEQAGYSRAGGLDTEMIVRQRRRQTPARRAIEKSDLNQIRFDDLLDRIFLLVNGSGNGSESHRAAAEFLDDRQKQFAVHLI